MSGVSRALAAAALCASVAHVAASSGCVRACRRVDVTPVAFQCTPDAGFSGSLERHFDDAATFESFLEIECLPGADDAEVAELVGAVDFTRDGVFVAAGDRAQPGRCIGERDVDAVDVCDDGLRVGFSDVLTEDESCGGKWTVAFAIAREELRAALDVAVDSTADF